MVRAGYSVVGPKAWLRPHFGATNGVLKLHLGLTVPSQKSGEPCARLKVAKKWGHWVEGDVILFDDSFEHEVINECNQPRSVFQVVVRHPDLPYRLQRKELQQSPSQCNIDECS